jgi:hypothetical protein
MRARTSMRAAYMHGGDGTGVAGRRLTAVLLLAATLSPAIALAEQPRDWMVRANPEGGRVNIDLVYPGTQIGYEHTVAIYGAANALTLRGADLLTAAFNDIRVDADLRILALRLGATAGYRDNWRACTFRRDQAVDRAALRDCDNTVGFSGMPLDHGSDDFPYAKLRLGLDLPFNDWVVYSGTTELVFEDRPARSLDRRAGVVRDADMLVRSEHFLLFHHRGFGGAGPLFQLLDYELGTERRRVLAYGFMLVGRPGFTRENDLLLLQMLFHFGDSLGGGDYRAYWGAHNIYTSDSTLVTGTRVPLSFLLAYRMVFNL